MKFNKFIHKALAIPLIMSTLLLTYGCNANSTSSVANVTSAESAATSAPQSAVDEKTQDEAVVEEEHEKWVRPEYVMPESLKDSEYDLSLALTEEPLKDAFSKYFKVGTAINGNSPSNATIESPELREIMKYHFNGTVYSNLMKASSLLDKNGCIAYAKEGNQTDVAVNFAPAIPGLEFATENGFVMRGHTLVWHNQAPSWFFKVDYDDGKDYVDKETMLVRMENYIKTVLEFTQENYPGIVYCWDVVNEAVEPGAGMYDNSTGWYTRTKYGDSENYWYTTIGVDYVEKAFEYARKYADPDVKLFYNDYNTFDTVKNSAICKMVEMLQEKDLIDGIGMQSNYGLDWPKDLKSGGGSLRIALMCFAALNVEIHMSETSFIIDGPEQFEAQAKRLKDFFDVVLEMDTDNGGPANITNVTFFGLMDQYLFYDNNQTYHWLFDAQLQPKPAFYAAYEALDAYR